MTSTIKRPSILEATGRTTAGSITFRAMALGVAILVGCALPAAADEDEESGACEHQYALMLAKCDALPRSTEAFAFCMAQAEVNYAICKGIEASPPRMNSSSPPGRNFTPIGGVRLPVAGGRGVRVPITAAPADNPVRPIRLRGIPPSRRVYAPPTVGRPITIYARGGGMRAGHGG